MGIRIVDSFPLKKSKKTVKSMVVWDINDAINRGIDKFEFVGYPNNKYLAGYVNDIAKEITRSIIKQKIGDRPVVLSSDDPKYVHAFAQKDDKGNIHVYCEILPDNLDILVDKVKGGYSNWEDMLP